MSEIKAIETEYAGCRFRSRLEARWGVFFEALGTSWLYEPQGYDIGGRWYLPDFWLPEYRCWVEVKGRFREGEWELLTKAAAGGLPAVPDGLPVNQVRVDVIGAPTILLLGQIPEPNTNAVHTVLHQTIGPGGRHVVVHSTAIIREGWLLTYGNYPIDNVQSPDAFLEAWNGSHHTPESVVERAYSAARGARFEHGETPPHGAAGF